MLHLFSFVETWDFSTIPLGFWQIEIYYLVFDWSISINTIAWFWSRVTDFFYPKRSSGPFSSFLPRLHKLCLLIWKSRSTELNVQTSNILLLWDCTLKLSCFLFLGVFCGPTVCSEIIKKKKKKKLYHVYTIASN